MTNKQIKDEDNIIYFEDRLKLLDSLLKKESIKTISKKFESEHPDYIKLKGSLKESLCKKKLFYLMNYMLINKKIYKFKSSDFYSDILNIEINKIKEVLIKNNVDLESIYSDGFIFFSQMLENDFFEVEKTYDLLLKEYSENYLIERIFENLDKFKIIKEAADKDECNISFNIRDINLTVRVPEIRKPTKEYENNTIIMMLMERYCNNSFVVLNNVIDKYILYYNNDDINYNFKTLKDFSKDFNISYDGLIYLLSLVLKDSIKDYIYLETGYTKDKGLLAINEMNKKVFKEKNMLDRDFIFFKNTKYAFKASLLEVIKEIENYGSENITTIWEQKYYN